MMDGAAEHTANLIEAPIDTKATARASLLTLPGELRNRIYRLALVTEEPIRAGLHSYPGGEEIKLYNLEHRNQYLLFVCKQVYQEARTIFFEDNIFLFFSHYFDSLFLEIFERTAGSSAKRLSMVIVEHSHCHYFVVKQSSSGGLQIFPFDDVEYKNRPPARSQLANGEMYCSCKVVHAVREAREPTPQALDDMGEPDDSEDEEVGGGVVLEAREPLPQGGDGRAEEDRAENKQIDEGLVLGFLKEYGKIWGKWYDKPGWFYCFDCAKPT